MDDLIRFEYTVSGFDDTVTFVVNNYEIIASGFNWGSEYFEEKGYAISNSYSYQEFYRCFYNSEDHKPIIDYLISNALVDTTRIILKEGQNGQQDLQFALKPAFQSLVSAQNENPARTKQLWKEVTVQYNNPARHYHTLSHLRSLMGTLSVIQSELQDWETLQVAIFNHDVVYDVSRRDNEQHSADSAKRVMQALDIEPHRITRCYEHILATQGHHLSKDNDTNFFTDADLSILGAAPDVYAKYSSDIRKEYSVFPDKTYCEGRINVLKKFIAMPRIYKTQLFLDKFEDAARKNLTDELQTLMTIT